MDCSLRMAVADFIFYNSIFYNFIFDYLCFREKIKSIAKLMLMKYLWILLMSQAITGKVWKGLWKIQSGKAFLRFWASDFCWWRLCFFRGLVFCRLQKAMILPIARKIIICVK